MVAPPPYFGTGSLLDSQDPRDYPLFSADQIHSIISGSASAASSEPVPVPGGATTSTKPSQLPELPPVYNQGQIGSCTTNAVLAALRYAHHKLTGKPYSAFDPSRLFLYYNVRTRYLPEAMNSHLKGSSDWDIGHDTGSSNRACINSLNVDGVCSEITWPYGTPDTKVVEGSRVFNTDTVPNPTDPGGPEKMNKAENEARPASHPRDVKDLKDPAKLKDWLENSSFIPRTLGFYRIFDARDKANVEGDQWQWNSHPDIALLEQSLSQGFPFIFSVSLTNQDDLGWEYNSSNNPVNKHINSEGVLYDPPANFSRESGHAMLAVGFDSVNKRFLVQNSWGTDWPYSCPQLEGRFWMPYTWFTQSYSDPPQPIATDFWVIKFSVQ